MYSPRMWRWSLEIWSAFLFECVFSTYVEVILLLTVSFGSRYSILHVCGGDPLPASQIISWYLYSPRMWRWSHLKILQLKLKKVFSTYVEVILIFDIFIILSKGILHVCGGDPIPLGSFTYAIGYSPRVWRWSFTWLTKKLNPGVFSTHVEAK